MAWVLTTEKKPAGLWTAVNAERVSIVGRKEDGGRKESEEKGRNRGESERFYEKTAGR